MVLMDFKFILCHVVWEFWIRIMGDRMAAWSAMCVAQGASLCRDKRKGNARIAGNGNGRIPIGAVVGDAST